MVLHWIRGSGEFKQFVGNRVRKIREKDRILSGDMYLAKTTQLISEVEEDTLIAQIACAGKVQIG